ncbi:MAG: hypothetical protein ACRBN8_28810 [Nannocystales bacterium]
MVGFGGERDALGKKSWATATITGAGDEIGRDTTLPYGFHDVVFPEGTYVLTATAERAAGEVLTSDAVTLVVGDPPPGTTGGGDESSSQETGCRVGPSSSCWPLLTLVLLWRRRYTQS